MAMLPPGQPSWLTREDAEMILTALEQLQRWAARPHLLPLNRSREARIDPSSFSGASLTSGRLRRRLVRDQLTGHDRTGHGARLRQRPEKFLDGVEPEGPLQSKQSPELWI